MKLEVRQYIPIPGDGSGTSDYSHISADIAESFNTMNSRDQANVIGEMYKNNPVLMTIQRNDGQRCCGKMPCKWLSTFVCFHCCQDGVSVYAGAVEDDPKGEKGRPGLGDPNHLIGSVIQPNFGGWVIPTLEMRGEGQDETATPFGKIEGPCCFGGWSEMCCDFRFTVSNFASPSKTGDLAFIIKKKPQSLAGGLRQLFSDADVYHIEFNGGANLTASQKATVLAGQLLADYMFFDGNTEKCKNTDDAIYCYCCYFSCIGYLCPIYIAIPKNSN